jgi:hypothetical protein
MTKTITEIQNIVKQLAEKLNVPTNLLPTFSSPIGDATPNIEVDNLGLYNYVINEIQTFAKNYTDKDFDRIKFDWNGKHADHFEDKNIDFRMQLCETIKNDFSYSSDKLILDLYLELSKCAKETWSVYNSFHLFADELLERGGIKYFDEYLEGASKSMDTNLSSGRLDLSKERVSEILSHIKSTIANSNKESDIRGYDYMLKRFEWLSEKETEKNNKTEIKTGANNVYNSLWERVKT